jgi:hypothetical protein
MLKDLIYRHPTIDELDTKPYQTGCITRKDDQKIHFNHTS